MDEVKVSTKSNRVGAATESAHTAAHARGGVWSSDLTKRAKSKFANNICGAAMLGFREDIRRSQFAWAQTWNSDMQASMLDPAETLEGFWAAQDILRKACIKAKGKVTRSQYGSETWIGPMHAWRDGQEQVYAQIYKCSRLVARVYKTACWAGYRHIQMVNLPSLDVFKQAIMKVLFNVGSFAALGEEPPKFFDSVLGVFMTALLADAWVEGGAAMIMIDVMPPMATSVKAMHRGDNLVDYHHIDSIAYFKALPEGLQKIFIMNHDAIVSFLVIERQHILEAALSPGHS